MDDSVKFIYTGSRLNLNLFLLHYGQVNFKKNGNFCLSFYILFFVLIIFVNEPIINQNLMGHPIKTR